MRVNVGPYVNWVGPYQIARLIRYIGFSNDSVDNFGNWLSETWVSRLCSYFHDLKKRKVSVIIDDYDIWNANHTMSIVIHPILVKLRAYPYRLINVENKDVPKEMMTSTDVDKNNMIRTDYVLDEMIFAFEQILYGDEKEWKWTYKKDGSLDFDKFHERNDRINEGLRFFGKYFRKLWT